MKDLSWIHNHQSQFYIIKHSSSHLMPNDDIIKQTSLFQAILPFNTKYFSIFTNKNYLGFISIIREIACKMTNTTSCTMNFLAYSRSNWGQNTGQTISALRRSENILNTMRHDFAGSWCNYCTGSHRRILMSTISWQQCCKWQMHLLHWRQKSLPKHRLRKAWKFGNRRSAEYTCMTVADNTALNCATVSLQWHWLLSDLEEPQGLSGRHLVVTIDELLF